MSERIVAHDRDGVGGQSLSDFEELGRDVEIHFVWLVKAHAASRDAVLGSQRGRFGQRLCAAGNGVLDVELL